jgi:hypothetical protein
MNFTKHEIKHAKVYCKKKNTSEILIIIIIIYWAKKQYKIVVKYKEEYSSTGY